MAPTSLPIGVRAWFEKRTFGAWHGSFEELSKVKRHRRLSISACLPALNEVATIGPICEELTRGPAATLVDELVVIDSDSTDGTSAAAAAAGARVLRAADLLPSFGPVLGKGDALWRGLTSVRGDVVLWLDSDVKNFESSFVAGLLAPILQDDSIRMVKAFYERPLEAGEHGSGETGSKEGARVTELTARPLLQLLFPELTGFIQPLAGEIAFYREDAYDRALLTGYAVDVGLLIDQVIELGLERLAQADLGVRVHRNQDTKALGRMASQVARGILSRAEDLGRIKLAGEALEDRYFQFDEAAPIASDLPVVRRPSVRSVLV